jgi:hypothetical protein
MHQAGVVKLLAPAGGRTPIGSSNGSTDGSPSLAYSSSSSRQLGRKASNSGGSSSSSSSAGGGAVLRLPQPQQQQQLSGLQLAVLGPGSLLGENLLGYNAEEVSRHTCCAGRQQLCRL